MKLITAIVKPYRLDEVKTALQELGVHGLAVTEASGYGRHAATRRSTAAPSTRSTWSPRSGVEVVVEDATRRPRSTRSSRPRRRGRWATGRCRSMPVETMMRVRTGERGPDRLLSRPRAGTAPARSERPRAGTAPARPDHHHADGDARARRRPPSAAGSAEQNAVSPTPGCRARWPSTSRGPSRVGAHRAAAAWGSNSSPAAAAEGIFVSSRDSNVRPKRPSALSRTFGFRVTFPVLWRVYGARWALSPRPGTSGWRWLMRTFSTARAGGAVHRPGGRSGRRPAELHRHRGGRRVPGLEALVECDQCRRVVAVRPSGARRVNGTVTEPSRAPYTEAR